MVQQEYIHPHYPSIVCLYSCVCVCVCERERERRERREGGGGGWLFKMEQSYAQR